MAIASGPSDPSGRTAIASLGCDAAVLVDLSTARSAAVLAPGRSSDNRGFFFAGWVP